MKFFGIPSLKQVLATARILAIVGALGFGINFVNNYQNLKADKVEAELVLNLRAEEIARLKALAITEAENRVIAENGQEDLNKQLEALIRIRNAIDNSEGNDAEVAPVLNNFLDAIGSR